MKLKTILLISACLFLLAIYPVSADSSDIPTLPAQFSGTLYNHEGKPFPVGTVITAEVNGVISTYTITEAGKIGGHGTFDDKFLITGAIVGSEITFKIEGTNVEVKQIYNPSSSQQIEQIQLIMPVTLPDSETGSGGGYVSGGTSSYYPTPVIPEEPDNGEEPISPIDEKPITENPTPSKTPCPIMGSLLALVCAVILAGRK